MTQEHPITPPPELVQQWRKEWLDVRPSLTTYDEWMFAKSAQWGYEQRAALAEPEPEDPTDAEIMALMPQQMHEDLAAAVQSMAEQAGTDSTRAKGMMRIILNGHVVDHARAVLARWGK